MGFDFGVHVWDSGLGFVFGFMFEIQVWVSGLGFRLGIHV